PSQASCTVKLTLFPADTGTYIIAVLCGAFMPFVPGLVTIIHGWAGLPLLGITLVDWFANALLGVSNMIPKRHKVPAISEMKSLYLPAILIPTLHPLVHNRKVAMFRLAQLYLAL